MAKHLNICTRRKLLFVLLYILGYGNLNSQIVKDYFKYINHAEIAFYNGDPIATKKSYEHAFSQKPTIFDSPALSTAIRIFGKLK